MEDMEDKKLKSFCKKNNIELLVLFGSYVSGKVQPESDIDIAIKLKRSSEISKLDLIYKLDDLFNGKNIDLVNLTKDTDPLLLYEVFFSGKLLYEEYSGLFGKEKLKAWKLYIDSEKFRAVQRKYLKEFVERVYNVL